MNCLLDLSVALAHAVYQEMLSKPAQRRFVEESLRFVDEHLTSNAARVKQLLRQMPVPGFRKKANRPRGPVVSALLSNLPTNRDMFGALFIVWHEYYREPFEAAILDEQLDIEFVSDDENGELDSIDGRAWFHDALREIKLVKVHENLPEPELCQLVAAAYLGQKWGREHDITCTCENDHISPTASGIDSNAVPAELRSELLVRFVAELRALPSSAIEFEEFELFLNAIRSVKSEKATEIDALKAAYLSSCEIFLRDHRDDLEYWEKEFLYESLVAVKDKSLADLEVLTTALKKLSEVLSEHNLVRRIVPSRQSEEKSRIEKLSKLSKAIDELFDELTTNLDRNQLTHNAAPATVADCEADLADNHKNSDVQLLLDCLDSPEPELEEEKNSKKDNSSNPDNFSTENLPNSDTTIVDNTNDREIDKPSDIAQTTEADLGTRQPQAHDDNEEFRDSGDSSNESESMAGTSTIPTDPISDADIITGSVESTSIAFESDLSVTYPANAPHMELASVIEPDTVAATAALQWRDHSTIDKRLVDDFVWTMIANRQLPLAFHFSRACKQLKLEHTVPHWAIGALLLSTNVSSSNGAIVDRVCRFLANFDEPEFGYATREISQPMKFLLFAASLRPAVVAPITNAHRILKGLKLSGFKSLNELIETSSKFIEHNRLLDLGSIKKAVSINVWKNDASKLKNKIVEWRNERLARLNGISYVPAREVVSQWLKNNGMIGEVLTRLESQNDHSSQSTSAQLIQICQESLSRLEESGAIDTALEQTLLDIGYGRIKVEANALRKTHAVVSEFLDLLREWLFLQETNPDREKSYSQKETEKFLNALNRISVDAKDEVSSFVARYASRELKISGNLAIAAIQNLLEIFSPTIAQNSLSETSPASLENLDLLLVGASLNNDGSVKSDSREIVSLILATADGTTLTLKDAFDFYLNRRNHIATQLIIELLRTKENKEADLNRFAKMRTEHVRQCVEDLRENIEATQATIESVGDLGLLKENEQLHLIAKVERVRNLLSQSSKVSGVGSPSFGEFCIDFGELDLELSNLRADVNNKKVLECERVEALFNELAIPEHNLVYDSVRKLLNGGDVWTAREYLEMYQRGESISEIFGVDSAHSFLSFKRVDEIYLALETSGHNFPRMVERELRDCARKSKHNYTVNGFDWTGVLGKQAEISADLINGWYSLKHAASIDARHLKAVFNSIGFNFHASIDEKKGSYWSSLIETDEISERENCPSPHFGSDAKGRYRVISVWSQPSMEMLLNYVGETARESRPTIVLFFRRLNSRMRRDLARLSKNRRRTFIVLDEVLMWHLSTLEYPRLHAFFAAALPLTLTEPYTTTAGRVPSEMFYGRKRERDEVISPRGGSFIYGGRQLGKTALLRHAQRFFHDPKKGKIAIFFDIKYHGICQSKEIDEIWGLLAMELVKFDVLPANITARITREKLTSKIEEWLAADLDRRILLLLDEADDFLEYDGDPSKKPDPRQLKREFERTTLLAGLMKATDGRFKVVFAGLHNVQRTTKLPNHILAHLGDPICVGPLLMNGERREARALIEKPFRSLGYEFANPDLITRIAWQTNYFPSLIQLYCQRLLQYLTDTTRNSVDFEIPQLIEQRHIEEAYNKELREDIRRRLILTLQLDQRYEVIGYIIALNSLSGDDQVELNGFSVDEIRQQAVFYWQAGFEHCNSAGEIRALLDEMVGLGLLRNVDDEHYALRSQNVATLIGTEAEIESVLLREREAKPVYDPSTFRALGYRDGRPDSRRRSPLTEQHLTTLRSRSFDTHIIVGMPVAGIDEVSDFLTMHLGNEVVSVLSKIDSAHTFQERLRADLAQRKAELRIVVVPPSVQWDLSWCEASHDYLTKLSSKEHFVKVVFLAGPSNLWNIIRYHNETLQTLITRKSLKISSLSAWHDSAVRHWLEEIGQMPNEKDRSELRRVSGNWPTFLYRFGEILEKQVGNFNSALAILKTEMVDSRIATEFGFPDEAACTILLSQMLDFVDVDDDITPRIALDLLTDCNRSDLESTFDVANDLGVLRVTKDGFRFDPSFAKALKNQHEPDSKLNES